MIVPDANLLLYAYNIASPFHVPAKAWWEACLSGSEPVGLAYPVLFSFIRVSTSTPAFPNPFTVGEAHLCVHAWLGRSCARLVHPATNHLDEVCEILTSAGSAGGNLVTDAQIAAIALAHKATVHTADHDFMRFKGLKCHFPLDGD